MESAPPQFAAAQDIPRGGLLLAVPALLATGLLRHSLEMYALPRGYYGLSSIMLLLNQPGGIPDAIARLLAAQRANPRWAEAHRNPGTAFSLMRQFPAAVEEYEKTLQIDPKYPVAGGMTLRMPADARIDPPASAPVENR